MLVVWHVLNKNHMSAIFYLWWILILPKSNIATSTIRAVIERNSLCLSATWCSNTVASYYNSSSICLCVCVCLFVCSLSPPRSFDGSSPNLVGVCRWTSHLPLRGSFSKRSTGRRVNGSLSLSTILYIRQPHATRCNGAFCFDAGKQQSLILRLLLHCISTLYVGAPPNCPWGVLFLKGQRVDGSMGRWVNGSNGSHLNGVCRWTSQLPWGVLFWKGQQVDGSTGQTGQRVNRSTGQRVKRVDGSTGHFHFHYIIYDSRRPHPAAKTTRRMMTPGSRHTTAKSTQRLLLARRVNFLVMKVWHRNATQCFQIGI